MHVTIVYDVAGVIKGLAAAPANAGIVQLDLNPGERSLEIDMPDMDFENGESGLARLDELKNKYRVDLDSVEGKLVAINPP